MRYLLSLVLVFLFTGCQAEQQTAKKSLAAEVVVYGDAAVGASAAVQAHVWGSP